MTETTRKIIEQILSVPKGKVSSYSGIALKAGLPNGTLQTVRTIHAISEKHNLPWHRIIRADGQIALEREGRALQIKLLKAEGVKVSPQGKVDMGKFGV